jgi:hypothetical protein
VLNALRIFDDEPDYDLQNFYFDIYADQLVRLVKEELPDTPFAICLNGGWGEGKTSLLRRVYNRLKEDENKKIKVLWFNAWQYERLDPVLALLQKIGNEYGNTSKKLNDIIEGLGLLFLDVVSRKTIGLGLNEIKKHFESSVREIQTIPETLEALIGIGRKLIIFVDDLDRCSIDNTNNILESIKLLFSAKNTKFVVGADMKMLETAWALKHKLLIESPYEGREHLEKIFQLKLSLPSKVFIHYKEYVEESDDDENADDVDDRNKLIKDYIENLVPGLPVKLRNLITDAFPPNPRKIKRAMSLAYFIGKNLNEMDDGKFRKIFPFVLFWTVTTTYYPDLARMVKISPRILYSVFQLMMNTLDMSDLILALERVSRGSTGKKGRREDVEARREDVIDRVLNQSTRFGRFCNEHLGNDRLMFRFLKAFVSFLEDSRAEYKEEELEEVMRYVIERAGLIS